MSLTSLTPERWDRVRATLEAVRGLDAAARAARLDELLGGDSTLRDEVERQLAVDAFATLSAAADSGNRTLVYTPSQAGTAQPDSKALGRYRLLRLLGRGGMGVVFLADDEQLQRTVAIKMVSGAAAGDEASLGRFRAEAAAVARLLHPNVVQVYDWGECESGPYFVMEYVAGGSLADRLREDRLPPAEAARLVRLLARAVHAAHQRGILHRDLKPGNVLLAPPSDEPALNFAWGCPKVGDFGLAVRIDAAHEATGAISGTPAYMSPEQAAGSAQVGPASDVYSLGVVLYELLTGTKPFEGSAMTVVMEKVRTAAPEPPSRRAAVPAELERVCLKCLEKDPAKRYESAADLATALLGAADAPPRRKWRWPIKIAVSISITFGCALFAVALLAPKLGMYDSRPVAQAERRKVEPNPAPSVEHDPETKADVPEAVAKPKPKNGKLAAPPPKNDKPAAVKVAPASSDKERAEAARVAKEKAEAERIAMEKAEAERVAKEKAEAERMAKEKVESLVKGASVRAIHVLTGHRAAVTALAFLGKGDRLLSGEDRPPAGSDRSSPVIVWNVIDGDKDDSYSWYYDRTLALAVAPDGRTVAAQGGLNGAETEVFDAVAKRTVTALFQAPREPLRMAFAVNGNLGGVGLSETFVLWPARRQNPERTVQAKDPTRNTNPVTAVALLPDLTVAASGHRDGSLRLWDTKSGHDLDRVNPVHAGPVTALAFDPDGRRLASVGADGSLRVRDVSAQKEVLAATSGGELQCVAWSKYGTKLVTGGKDGLVRVWDAATGRELLQGTGHEGPVTCVAASPDGSVCASGGEDKTVRVWPLKAK